MILVDSSARIDYSYSNKTSHSAWLNASLGNTPLIMGDLMLTEFLQGFQSDKDFKIAKDLINGPCLTKCPNVPIT